MDKKNSSWAYHNLHARKEEFLKQIQAYIKDQHAETSVAQLAEYLEVSRPTVGNIIRGKVDELTLDTLYRVAMTLEMGATVHIPIYGTYHG